jgi:hypothetical protein
MQKVDAIWTNDVPSTFQVKEYTFEQFVDAAENGAKTWPDDAGVTGSASFSGSPSFDKTIERAKFGNDSATKLVKMYSEKIEQQFTFTSMCDYMLDVQGQTIDIGTLLTGNPEHWMQPIESHSLKSDKLIEISVDSTFSGMIAQTSIAYRGALIAALVDALRVRGFSVKLTLCYSSELSHTSAIDGKHYEGWVNKVIVINYGEVSDLSRVAFALADSSMYRRMGFVCKNYFTGRSGSAHSMASRCPKEHRSKIHFTNDDGLFDIGSAPSERQLRESVKWLESKISDLTETLNS